MKTNEFLPVYLIRSPNIMWFLGAGASAAAGIPTAWDMIWDFKRTIFCSSQQVSIQSCQDLNDPKLRLRLQAYFDSKAGFPAEASNDEYAFYFQYLYTAEADRRRYIDQLVSRGKPSYGHKALSALMKLDKARIVWTTNFERMLEDAIIPLLGSSGKLVTVNLDNAKIAMEALNEGRWPLVVKLHGDFQSSSLKNTSDELKNQDAQLSYALVEACKRYGLAVVGYSGRDQSVMDALEAAIDGGRGFPAGLFWFYRSDTPLRDRIPKLIESASAQGIEAHLIEVETFDELMADLLILTPDLPMEIETYINQQPRPISNATLPPLAGTWPIVRTNALRILSWPSTCRRVVCDIGGVKEVRDAIAKSNADIICARRSVGVLAFGRDLEIKKAFSHHKITEFDIHSIADKRLYFDSQELGLLYETFVRAVQRQCPIRVQRKRNRYVLTVDPARVDDSAYSALKSAAGSITGTIARTKLHWEEAVKIRLEFRLDRLWLLLEPEIWVEDSTDEIEIATGREYVRDRLTRRYNVKWNSLLEGWIRLLTGTQSEREFRSFGISDGIDAVFLLSNATAFSEHGKQL